MKETTVLSVDESLPYLIAVRDSVFQFELMTIQEDYERVAEGGDYLSREMLKIRILPIQEIGSWSALNRSAQATNSSSQNSGRSILIS